MQSDMTDETIQDETPAEAAPVEPAESAPAPVVAEPTADDASAEISKIQKRIDKLTWERGEKEREAEYWRNLALQRQEQPKEVKTEVPTLEQFGYDESKFREAWQKYTDTLVDEKISTRLAEKEQEAQRNTVVKSFKTRESEFKAKTPDYEEKVYDPSKTYFTNVVAELIAGSEDGPAVAYYLADNPEIGSQIARLPPIAAAREIGKIEAKLVKPQAPQISRAPNPPPKADEAAETVTRIAPDEAESDKLSNDDWIRKRNAQEARKKAARK